MKLPVISGEKTIKALAKAGFKIAGQKGSHVRLKKKTNSKIIVLVVPNHKELSLGTLNDIIKQANLSREQFIKLL